VIACAPGERAEAQSIVEQAPKGCCLLHVCSVEGLIGATRRARAVVGVDSGPLHLASALERPGVALFGPTDPARNGPYGNSIVTLRSPDAVTSYKRTATIAPSMWAIEPEQVFQALERRLSPNPILEPHR
jgi:heptosyltransferase-1